ncbi:hypothetical protein AYY18_05225 [Morganella psychrotolerans]|uniref:Uncharacterized protein n=1 Tax=Morganella psychrotolerans TaxID=368603 RepID=A0A1B8HEX6_9GAMM|nr:hypothetical protein AYY18_05225 [Morganella psychrotolerans]
MSQNSDIAGFVCREKETRNILNYKEAKMRGKDCRISETFLTKIAGKTRIIDLQVNAGRNPER